LNAAGKAEIPIENAASARIEREAVADCIGEEESVTLTLKLEVAAAVAIPVIAPVDVFNAKPRGKAPPVTDQV
jgi:hypothetical protein